MAPAWPFGVAPSTSSDNNRMLPGELTTALSPVPPLTIAAGAIVVGAVGGRRFYVRYLRRIVNAGWVTSDMLREKRWVRGYVTRVRDGDDFQLYHTPSIGWRWPLKFRRIPDTTKTLKDQTIHIRIAGVDAPECAHRGKEAQPGSELSLAWLKSQIEGRTLWCQLLRKDQYFRIVAVPYLPPRFLPGAYFLGKPLPLEMLRAGVAGVYTQGGAEYGKWGKEKFLELEAEAQFARRGIWKDGIDIETPGEYKKRIAAGAPEPTPPLAKVAETPAKRGTRKPVADDVSRVTTPPPLAKVAETSAKRGARNLAADNLLRGPAPTRRSTKTVNTTAKARTGAKPVLNRAVGGLYRN